MNAIDNATHNVKVAITEPSLHVFASPPHSMAKRKQMTEVKSSVHPGRSRWRRISVQVAGVGLTCFGVRRKRN